MGKGAQPGDPARGIDAGAEGATLAYRADIDGLRAVAILTVLLFHLGVSWMPGGFVGVDVFFVISGYLITAMIVGEYEQTRRFSYAGFYLRRLRRLGPALIFTLLVTAAVATALLAPHDLQRLGAGLVHAVTSLSNVLFWSQAGYFEADSETNPLLHTWSLSVEEQFYMVWPALLVFLMARVSRKRLAKILSGLMVLSLALNLAFSQAVAERVLADLSTDTAESLRAAVFFLTPFRIYELALGGILVFLPAVWPGSAWLRELMHVVGVVLIGIAAVYYSASMEFPSYNALLPCLGAALVIQAGNPRVMGRLLRNRAMVWIGLRSYSLYLAHWPLIVFMRYWQLDALSAGQQILAGLVSLTIAAAMYRLVERPFRHGRTAGGGHGAGAGFVVASGVLATILVLLGANQWGNRGWI